MSDEKVTSTWDKYWWIVFAVFFIFLLISNTWIGVANKQYLASLSPAERAEIKLQEQQKAEEQKIQDEQNAKWWGDLFGVVGTNPMWMFVLGNLVGYLLAKMTRGMSYY